MEVMLWCGVYGEGGVFPVKIARDAKVSALQKTIFYEQRYNKRFSFPPSALTLYLAKKNGEWLKDDDKVKDFLLGRHIDKQYKEMRPTWDLMKRELLGPAFQPGEEEIQVLVELPEAAAGVARKQGGWGAEDLSTVSPQDQLTVWRSAVRVSSGRVCSETALVVDRTSRHLYLLTNLHLWVGETFADHLSAEFKTDIHRYLKIHPGMKTRGKRTKAPVISDKPEISIEQLQSDGTTMEVVHTFRLRRDVCCCSSADFDFAIFEVAVSQDIPLARCRMATGVQAGMRVHVFGFPDTLRDGQSGPPCAIIPAQVTGWRLNQMTLSLSAPFLSGSGIVCSKSGVPVGYIGGGFDDGSADNEQYQSYGFTLHGIPSDLPSLLPPDAGDETEEEL